MENLDHSEPQYKAETKEFILGDSEELKKETTQTRLDPVDDTCDLNTILDHLKAEKPFVDNLVNFVTTTPRNGIIKKEVEVPEIKEEIYDPILDSLEAEKKIKSANQYDDYFNYAKQDQPNSGPRKKTQEDISRQDNVNKNEVPKFNQSKSNRTKSKQYSNTRIDDMHLDDDDIQDSNETTECEVDLEDSPTISRKCQMQNVGKTSGKSNTLTINKMKQSFEQDTNTCNKVIHTDDIAQCHGPIAGSFEPEKNKALPTQEIVIKNKTNVHTNDIFCNCIECKRQFGVVNPLDSKKKKRKTGQSDSKKRPVCKLCNKTFYRNRALQIHMENIHFETKNYPCEKCLKAFPSQTYLNAHIKRIHLREGKKLECDECDKVFNYKAQFTKHKKKNHSCARKILNHLVTCEHCHKTFTKRSGLIHHWKTACKAINNRDKNVFICDHCDSKFRSKEIMRNHIMKHLPPSVKCEKCNSLFYNKPELQRHVMKHNSIGNKKSLFCEKCGQGFRQKTAFLQHVNSVHLKQKLFVCKTCEKSFGTSTNLYQHSQIHLNTRKFQCELCEKSFNFKHHLRQHMSVHGMESIVNKRKKLK